MSTSTASAPICQASWQLTATAFSSQALAFQQIICPALLFRREFWVFTGPTAPTGTYVPANGSAPADWPGGTLVLNQEVLPDGTAPYHHSVRVNIPPDTTFIGTVYTDHNTTGTGMNSTAYVAPINIDATADETARC